MRRPNSIMNAVSIADGGMSLAATPATLPDGTRWSHAACMGTHTKGGFTFTIDEETLTSFVKNFTAGYPSKVPVDYDHGSTSGIADGSQPVPKAGDVYALKAIVTDADITPEIQAEITRTKEEYAAMGVDKEIDARGLWMRWRPTQRALGYITAREYTELSIAFDDDWPDKNGIGQGPTILAVALCNRPFLDTMVSVAAAHSAARVNGGNGAESPEENGMSNVNTPNRFLLALSIIAGKPVETDAQAETTINQLSADIKAKDATIAQLTSYRDVVAAELGSETDPIKAVTKIRALTTERDEARQSITANSETVTKGLVESTMLTHEKKLTKPMREYMAGQLTKELAAGKKLDECETVIALKGMSELGEQTRTVGGDAGNSGNDVTHDSFVRSRAAELMTSDATIKALSATDPSAANAKAFVQAETEARARFGKK